MPFSKQIRISLFYLMSVGFILLNLYFVVKKDTVYITALPLLLAIVLTAIFSFDKIIYLIVLFTPLSLPLRKLVPGMGFDMYLPTEPLLFGLLIIFGLKLLHERKFDKRIAWHPVSLAVYLNLLWILVSATTSTMPIVSFKFLLMRIWFVAILYFLTAKVFSDGKHMEKYVWFYVVPFMIVIFYAAFRHVGHGLWNKQAAHFVVKPFYNDHTSYGAALAFYLPFVAMFVFNPDFSKRVRTFAAFVFAVVLMGFVLSYSRAAWLSIVAALGVWMLLLLKIRFRTVLILVVAAIGLFFAFEQQIMQRMEKNSHESSADLRTHISSMSNISTDASNLERLNRWSCAWRMFKDRPVFGFGPGTYMFKYAPYQLTQDRTIISTNAADGGNAHSEYLGPLSESGVMGLLTYLIIIGAIVFTAIKTYFRIQDARLKRILVAAFLGLITYFIHGFLNNFLDTDKISVPFWGFTAMIVVIDIISREKQKEAANSGRAIN